ncbi:hypothetical protein FNW02_13070 [Komarekiella sp. 'clone 1']|uniref:Transmembrane protein n=1 Tax=Komarekiella delphini-convector SJRDD-AB1 TaxID=2593771 RepID=A0AA40SXD9_9NOST|nr:hypothetical protein [Komarekiella delphini-convector SJRDD-AB1]
MKRGTNRKGRIRVASVYDTLRERREGHKERRKEKSRKFGAASRINGVMAVHNLIYLAAISILILSRVS